MSSSEKPYSPCVQVGNTIYVAGQLSLDGAGNVVGKDDIALQTKQTLDNLIAVLATQGASLDDIVMVNVYLPNIQQDFAVMNEVYRTYFSKPYPARVTVGSVLVDDKYLIEISATAVKQN